MRSQTAQKLLEENGFKKVLNLRGGINAWRSEVEPELAFY
jgi:rhodanese-related sulfurtransferase